MVIICLGKVTLELHYAILTVNLSLQTHITFLVLQNVIVLLLGCFYYCFVFHNDDINAFHPQFSDPRISINRRDHVRDVLQTFTECVKLPKNVILTKIDK